MDNNIDTNCSNDSSSTSYFAGKNICITGKLTYSTRTLFAEMLEKLGAHFSSSVSTNLDVLITGEGKKNGTPSGKLLKASQLNQQGLASIEILTEQQFFDKL